MGATEAPPGSFAMLGARAAINDGLDHIVQHVEALEAAIGTNPGAVFDLAKVLIEATSKRVLDERNQPYDSTTDLPRLFKMACNCTPMLPAGHADSTGARASLAKTVNGLSTAVQGIAEMRNGFGFASHGDGAARPEFDRVHAEMVAHAADTAVAFLYSCHRIDAVATNNRTPDYDDNPEFNALIDESYGIFEIYEVTFNSSEILYTMDPQTYRIYLTELSAAGEETSHDSAH